MIPTSFLIMVCTEMIRGGKPRVYTTQQTHVASTVLCVFVPCEILAGQRHVGMRIAMLIRFDQSFNGKPKASAMRGALSPLACR